RLAEAVGQLLPEHPSENVGAAAGRERHDEIDLAAGVVLRPFLRCGLFGRNANGGQRDQQGPHDVHGSFSRLVRLFSVPMRLTEPWSQRKRPNGRKPASLTSCSRIHSFRPLSQKSRNLSPPTGP